MDLQHYKCSDRLRLLLRREADRPMQIDTVDAILVDLPTVREHNLARQKITQQTLVLLRIKTDEGLEGLGEATTIGGLSYAEESPESIKLTLDRYIAPLLVGTDPFQTNSALRDIERHVVGNRFAKSAVETALLDIKAKALGVPVHQLFGGKLVSRMECVWGLASGDTEKDIEEAVEALAKRTHRAFKIKVGQRDLDPDIAHVTAIAKRVGSKASLRVDANQSWDEVTATRAMSAFMDLGIEVVEQPVAKTNIDAMVRLSERFALPVMADESVSTPEEALAFAKVRAASVFALKISKSGGLSGTRRVAAIAESAGIGLYGGTMLEGSIGTIASLHVFSSISQPFSFGTELFGPLLLRDDIVLARPAYGDFSIVVPDTPGIGVEIDEDKLAHYRRDKGSRPLPVASTKRSERA